MPTSRECVCCCEIEQVLLKKEESANRIPCITEHEGFDFLFHPDDSAVCIGNVLSVQTFLQETVHCLPYYHLV